MNCDLWSHPVLSLSRYTFQSLSNRLRRLLLNGFHSALLQLTYVRTLVLFLLSCALLFAVYGLYLPLDVWLIGSALAGLAVLNLVTFARLHSPWPVTEIELFSHFCADAVIFGFLLFQTGGATNPFIFLLLVPLLSAAATLSRGFVALMAVIVILLYTTLLQVYQPLLAPQASHQHSVLNLLDLHVTGMWINFLFTAVLVTWSISQMQQSLKQRESNLQREREKRIQDQQLLGLATMAAGTAHELGTPLSTLRITLSELAHTHPNDAELLEDVALMQEQVERCSQRLQQLAHQVRDDQPQAEALGTLLTRVLEEWSLMRPEVEFQLEPLNPQLEQARLLTSVSLQQALLNLLNNAADASPKGIEISVERGTFGIRLHIHDQGPGLPLEQADQLGKPFVTTKGRGLGIGLFLTATTLSQHQGEVRLYNHPAGGTLTEVLLPLLEEESTDG